MVSRRTLLALLACGTAVALTMASAGIPLGPGDQVHEQIVLSPTDTENGEYAVIDEQNELELLLTEANPDVQGAGVEADAVTPLHRVFTVTYTGDRFARVWISDDADDVRFFGGDEPDQSIEGAPNNVTLAPDETLVVGLLVDTRGHHDVEQASTFTVHAELADPEPTEVDILSPDAGSNDDSVIVGPSVPADTEPPTRSQEPTSTQRPTATPRPTTTPGTDGSPTLTPSPTGGSQARTATGDGSTSGAGDEYTPTTVTPESQTPTAGGADTGTETASPVLSLGSVSLDTLVVGAAAIIVATLLFAALRRRQSAEE